MIGTYDFCGHYEWTYAWLEKRGGEELVRQYWVEAIAQDSQIHARELIESEGFEGMMKYWGHTLAEESPDQGYKMTRTDDVVRCDMHDCPSKGFLIRNGLEQYSDYCNHCIGWIKPILVGADFQVAHEHNHCGQCWWEFRKADSDISASEPGEISGADDVRFMPGWKKEKHDVFLPMKPSQEDPSSPPSVA